MLPVNLSSIAARKIAFKRGYMIPRSMEWIFRPIGYKPPPEPIKVVASPGDVLTVTEYVAPISASQALLGRQFTITNAKEFFAAMKKAGVIKEAK